MTDPVGIAGDRVRSFVERIEQLDTELQEINEQRKEVFAEAKGEGFDVKVLKEIIKLRKQDKDERDEHEVLLDVYMRAMETASPEPVAEAAFLVEFTIVEAHLEPALLLSPRCCPDRDRAGPLPSPADARPRRRSLASHLR